MGHLQPDRMMLDQALAAVEKETGLRTTILGWDTQIGNSGQRADAVVEITAPEGRNYRFAVHMKKTARWENVQYLWTQWHPAKKERLLIVTPYVTPQVAQRCREMGVCFADTAGNMFLRAPGLHVYVVGKRAPDLL